MHPRQHSICAAARPFKPEHSPGRLAGETRSRPLPHAVLENASLAKGDFGLPALQELGHRRPDEFGDLLLEDLAVELQGMLADGLRAELLLDGFKVLDRL